MCVEFVTKVQDQEGQEEDHGDSIEGLDEVLRHENVDPHLMPDEGSGQLAVEY